MVEELARYVCDNPPDPTHVLEIVDLAEHGVDLSFFPNPGQIVFVSTDRKSVV